MERYLRVNLFGPGPCLMKKNLPGRGLTKFEKHLFRQKSIYLLLALCHKEQEVNKEEKFMRSVSW